MMIRPAAAIFHALAMQAFLIPRSSLTKGFVHGFGRHNGVRPPASLPSSANDIDSGSSMNASSIGKLLDPREVSGRVFAADNRPVILFDGVCNLCNGAVNTALDWDPKGKLRFSALQSDVGRSLLQANGKDADDISSIVLVTETGAYVKSDAILRITEALVPFQFVPLKPAAKLGRWVVPKFLRDLIYDGVANNRYDLMGKRDQCRFDADGEFDDRFINDELASECN